MTRIKTMSVICYMFILTGCVDVESEAKKAVINKLAESNPSVQEQNVQFGKFIKVGKTHACYSVKVPNPTNGTSSVDMQAMIYKTGNDWSVLQFSNDDESACVKTMGHLEKRSVAKEKGTDEPDCKKAVLKALKDPDSAKFGKFTVEGTRACLTVNARNSLGGYTGDQQAILELSDDFESWKVVEIVQLDHESCRKVINPFLPMQ